MSKSPNKILIVDDESAIRDSFIFYFEDRSWIPLEASSGEEGLSILEKENPAAAIVDIRMEGMDGNTFILEAHKRRPQTAFIIYTGSPEYEIPDELQKVTGLSKKRFSKPVNDINSIERELEKIILKMQGNGNNA